MAEPILIKAHPKDLGGGLMVRRLLPSALRQAVGPFLFFDHFGPVPVGADSHHDVRPHPHIGLATVTYLFEGVILHRDNLGFEQSIEPGAINWMTAGRGIVHSERRPSELAGNRYVNHGLQLWAALPSALEDIEPSFVHTPAEAIPEIEVGAARVRVLVGEAFDRQSPVATLSPTLYLDVSLPSGSPAWTLPVLAQEQAVDAVQGRLQIDGQEMPPEHLCLLEGQTQIQSGDGPLRFVVIGGQSLGHRHIWWNFVSSDTLRIDRAAADWAVGRVEAGMGPIGGDAERIEAPPRPVRP